MGNRQLTICKPCLYQVYNDLWNFRKFIISIAIILLMKISTQIIATCSPSLRKTLHTSFDHEYTIVAPDSTLEVGCHSDKSGHWMETILLNSRSGESCGECILTYNMEFDKECIRAIVDNFECFTRCEVFEYEIKLGRVKLVKSVVVDSCTC